MPAKPLYKNDLATKINADYEPVLIAFYIKNDTIRFDEIR
jgi:hypothetical protein